MTEFKDAAIGSQWELSDSRKMIVVHKELGADIHGYIRLPDERYVVCLFTTYGVCIGEPSLSVKSPWREKLRWEGEIQWSRSKDGMRWIEVGSDTRTALDMFSGKKTRMTLEEL